MMTSSSDCRRGGIAAAQGSGGFGWFFDHGNYDPFDEGYEDCYSSMNRCLDCWWYDDYENCKSSICVPNSIPSSGGEGDGKQQQEAVVCTTASIFSDDIHT